MPDYHVLTQDLHYRGARVAFHIPISGSGQNEAGVQWRDAVVAEQGGADNIESQIVGIAAAELADLKAGALLEHLTRVRFSSVTLTPGQRLAEIKAAYTEAASQIVADKQVTLAWIGASGNV